MVAQKRLREAPISESRVPTPIPRKSRRERLSASPATRVSPEEIAEVALGVTLPPGVTDVVMITACEPGKKLPNGDPSGLGGRTLFGPAFMIDGHLHSEPVALYESQKDALALHALLVGEEGELWERKRRRAEAIAAAEAAEAAAEAAEAEARKSGGGSPRRSRSSEKLSGGSDRKMRRASPRLFRSTPSRPSSS